jgi:hypothetical protein
LVDFYKVFSSETAWPNEPEDFLEINQSETRIVGVGHVCKRIGTKCAFFIEDLP